MRAQVDRSRLPEPGAVKLFAFPDIARSTLPGGLRVWTVRHDAVPVVSLMLLVRRGAADDPAGQDGLAAVTADMLDEGSQGRSAIEMHEALARIGCQLETDIGPDGTALTVSVLSRFTDRALVLLADMVARPSLTEADFARVRQLRLHRLRQLRDVPAAVAERAFARLLYGGDPYGHSPIGSERTVGGIEVDDVRRFHAAMFEPSSAMLLAVGDCEHDAIVRAAGQAFAGWSAAAASPAPVEAPLPAPPRLNVIARPGAPQSELRIGHIGLARHTPDYHAVVAANMVLGGQFVSRINLNLRQEKGYTYGARTGFDFRRRPGPFALQASVHTAATAHAVAESIREIEDIRGLRPITSDELRLGVAALTQGYARNFETAEQIARAVTQLALYDLPDDYFEEFVPSIERVTAAEATAVAARHLHPDRLTTLVVGDLEAIRTDLAALGLGEPAVLSAEAF
ncbi:MAG: M16 family metallopeptidase [Betaproteobacteria bacterium]